MDGKNELFQRLKPHCIAIAQRATVLKSNRERQDDIVERLERLEHILSTTASTPNHALDAKLADYVFFPLAQLLRESQKLSIRILELSLQCITILVDQGWKKDLPPRLASQVVILCTTLAERNPKGFAFDESTDELQASSFWCLHHIFNEAGKITDTKQLLTGESSFPQLGQTISVILEGIRTSNSVEPQVAGTAALSALVDHVLDVDIQASFLPGIASSLTKVLSPQSNQRRNPKVLVGCLSMFETLLRNTMNDDLMEQLSERKNIGGARRSVIDRKWQETAAAQLKPAISSILRLKSHGRDDVREAVAKFCTMLLQACRETLSSCTDISIEALVSIAASNDESNVRNQLAYLMRKDSRLIESTQNMLHSFLQNLPVITQSSDEEVKAARIAQISTIYRLLVSIDANVATLGRSMAVALRKSAEVMLGSPTDQQRSVAMANPMQSLSFALKDSRGKQFSSVTPFSSHSGHEKDMTGLRSLAQLVGTSRNTADFTNDIMRDLRQSSGQVQLANLWLLLSSTEASFRENKKVDDLVDLGEFGASNVASDVLEEIYAFALSTLNDRSDEEQDPRMLILALRGLALRARTAGQEFRYELVDALYPVLHTLATPDEKLQHESVTTLDTFTKACGYPSTRDLIVDNVDYLTNAVALKLNAFDVSPQAPQVLLMMVRLAGPSLLPYLEDTVESIFAALEDYHGYPLLVELLFKVLSAMAEEGVKSPQLALTDSSLQSQVADARIRKSTTVPGLAALLQHAAGERETLTGRSEREPHPKNPWKKPVEEVDDEETEDAELDQMVGQADPPPPAPKTYNLLFKITELTQHFLPSASPSLRTSLLALIKTTVPAIARHENSFLPLVNTLWPEVVSRLDDEEPYAVASAIEVVGLLCEYAGDFMRTRVEQVWPRLLECRPQVRFHKSTGARQSKADSLLKTFDKGDSFHSGNPNLFSGDTNTHLISEALISALAKIIKHVHVSPEMADDSLEVLAPVLVRPETRTVLEASNADALWLAEVKMGLVKVPERPRVDDSGSWTFANFVT